LFTFLSSFSHHVPNPPPARDYRQPTVGLDPQSRSRVWRLLDESRRRFRACIVLCTHHMEEAERLAQKVMIVKDGLVQCVGTIDDLRARFGAGYRIEIAPMAGTRAWVGFDTVL
jgi:ABC-type multidrug transport system ATPase subunit